jgi:leader peptidase (prepilin peptidase) / N-methyltransferase
MPAVKEPEPGFLHAGRDPRRSENMSTQTMWSVLGWAAIGIALSPVVQRLGDRPGMLQSPVGGRAAVMPALVTSVLFGLLAWRFGATIELLAFSALALIGVRLAMIDLAELRLPTALVMPLYPVILGLLSLTAAVDGNYLDLLRAEIGMLALPTAYLIVALLSQGGIGAGDIRLAGPVGLVLAWQSWTAVAVGTVIAFVYANIAVLTIHANGGATRHTPVPFGPAMLAGVFTFALVPWST